MEAKNKFLTHDSVVRVHKPKNQLFFIHPRQSNEFLWLSPNAFTLLELLAIFATVTIPIAILRSKLISKNTRYAAWAGLVVAEAVFLLSIQDQVNPAAAGTESLFISSLSPIRIRLAFLFLCLDSTIALGFHSLHHLTTCIRNLRWERVLHYTGLCCVGIWLSAPSTYSIVTVLAAVLTVTLAWGAAVVGNDLVDLNIDRVSNPDRPLVTGAWNRRNYGRFGLVMLALAVTGAWSVGQTFAFCILTWLTVAFLYSNPPFRLRRFLGISSALVGLASLITIIAGFICLGNRHIFDFPPNLAWFIFLGLTCGANLKDVKDFEGDRRDRVHTIVTTLGLRKGQFAVGVLVSVAMLSAPLLLGKPVLWLPAMLWASLAFFVSTRRRFREKVLFLIYYSYVAFLIASGALQPVP
jgi:4-hydroxybenzoate polyprenyltransferase